MGAWRQGRRDIVQVGELRQTIAMISGCSPEGVLLAAGGAFMGLDDEPLDALGVHDTARIDCALTVSLPLGEKQKLSKRKTRMPHLEAPAHVRAQAQGPASSASGPSTTP